jgi:hypothetical protein
MPDDFSNPLMEWRGNLYRYLLSKSLMGQKEAVELIEDFDDIIEGMDVPDVRGFTLKNVHLIDRLGCGLAVLSMYCEGMDTEAIAKVVETQTGVTISGIEVAKWIELYEKSGVVRQNTMTNLSIFDTKNRMEDIYLSLQKIMQDIEQAEDGEFSRSKTTRYEVQLTAMGQMRSAVKDARQIVEALHQMNTYRELANIILQEIAQESPSLQGRVLRRLKEKGAVIKAILPSA